MPPMEALPTTVGADSYLTLHYRVSLDLASVDRTDASTDHAGNGDVVNTFGTKPATLQLGVGQFSPALEERLVGLPLGARRTFELAAGVAFGPRNSALIQRLPRSVLEAESDKTDYLAGDVVEFNAPGGGRYAGVFRSIERDYAIFDFNHPLAGQPVRFEVEIVGIL